VSGHKVSEQPLDLRESNVNRDPESSNRITVSIEIATHCTNSRCEQTEDFPCQSGSHKELHADVPGAPQDSKRLIDRFDYKLVTHGKTLRDEWTPGKAKPARWNHVDQKSLTDYPSISQAVRDDLDQALPIRHFA